MCIKFGIHGEIPKYFKSPIIVHRQIFPFTPECQSIIGLISDRTVQYAGRDPDIRLIVEWDIVVVDTRFNADIISSP